jgi:type I restriction enzyme R subunit
VIIDEAHRSVYQKYGAIFAYFDSLLSGLTATPREEIDRNTYELFDREIGLPTDEYGLDQAVADGFLVPFKPISVPLRFPREGISYADLSDDEKAQWELLDWEENVQNAGRVDSGAINAWLFNADTVDKGLEVLMTQGCHEASGDRLGKSVIFARNHKHAEFIRERFDHHYPHLAGKAARVIDNEVKYAQSLIDDFADPCSDLRIAISVDMLDTGIDIPEIVNLVFFKPVRSRTKFWQMVGRGTRTCNNLFGPGRDKECFWIFDLCQNLEFFLGQGGAESTAAPETLSTRLFRSRLSLIDTIDQKGDQKGLPLVLPSLPSMAIPSRNGQPGDQDNALRLHRHTLAELLRCHVAALSRRQLPGAPPPSAGGAVPQRRVLGHPQPRRPSGPRRHPGAPALRLRRAAGRHRCGRPPFRSAPVQPAAHPVAR